MEEVWKPAVYSKFPDLVKDLEVSNLGRVRKMVSGKIFSQNDHKDGYRCIKRQGKTLYYHTFVAETFINARPEGLVVDHIDGNKNNNAASNLRFITSAHNCKKQDRVEETTPTGEVVFKAVRHWKENFIRDADRMKKDITSLQEENKAIVGKLQEAYAAINALGLMYENQSRLLQTLTTQTQSQSHC